jgi:ATP-dependent protease ClpP protease subunit
MYHVSKDERAIYLDDEIGVERDGRIGHETIVKGLAMLGPGSLTLRVSSNGGNLIEALKMFEALKRHRGQITVSVDGIAASAATIFLTEPSWIREASDTASVMIHRTSSGMIGNAIELRDLANTLERYDRQLAKMYGAVVDKSEDEILADMTAETYYDAAEALAIGFIDRIVGAPVTASTQPKLAKALARQKRLAMSCGSTVAAVRTSPAKRNSAAFEKALRLVKAERLAKASADRKLYERKREAALNAVRYGQDVRMALATVR